MKNSMLQFFSIATVSFAVLVVLSSYNDRLIRMPSELEVNAARHVDKTRKYDLAGEVVPMDNFDAVERLDREIVGNSYLHGSTILNIKLAARYFPYFEKTLAENNLPDDMKYLAVIESNLRNVISPAGA